MKEAETKIRKMASAGFFALFMLLLPSGYVLAQANAPVTLEGTCNDDFDGDLSATMEWSSSIDGDLGTGSNLQVSLTVGDHVITASCTDSAQNTATGSVNHTVSVTDNPPVVVVLQPADGGCTGDACP